MGSITPIKQKDFINFLLFIGCEYKRTKGDHLIFSKPGLTRPIVITADREIMPFIVRSNLRTLGISTEEYLKILKQV